MTFGNRHGTLTLHKYTGAWRYTLDNADVDLRVLDKGDIVFDDFVLRITDEEGASVTKTVRIRITGENDAPRLYAEIGAAPPITVVARDRAGE